MSSSRPDTFFAITGTNMTLLGGASEPPVWVKTRRTMSIPLWQHQISLAELVRPGSVTYHSNQQEFRLQLPGAVQFSAYLDQRGQLPDKDPVPMALGLLNLLEQWHRQGVALLSLTPRHLLYQPGSNEFWAADWSLALPYADAPFDILTNLLTDEITHYASPEQTGKTDLPLDYRSDYFSLGVLLYRLTTGQLPFDGLDSPSIVYRILTYEPAPLRSQNPYMSAGFESIVSKMLAKNPDNRYQSAEGLRHDLMQLAQPDFDLTTFRPGAIDGRGEFLTKAVLVGRHSILRDIDNLLNHVSEHQQKGIALVEGELGSGKTALLNQLDNLYFNSHFVLSSNLRDDHEQPYSAIKSAFEAMADGLLGQSLAVQNDFKFHLDSQIGNVSSVLVDFCPGIRKHIDTIAQVQPVLTGTSNQDRLAYVVAGFLRALVLTGRPVVWLLDNFQDSSDATLRLFDSLTREAPLTQLTFVGMTVPGDSSQQMQRFVDGVKLLEHTTFIDLSLPDLTEADLADWLLELHVSPESCKDVATLIYQKTGGNPFSVQRILQQVYEQGAVSKSPGGYFFQLNTTILSSFQTTDNLLDYLTDQIKELPPDARQLFDLAACFRQPFSNQELAILADTNITTIGARLNTLVVNGIFVSQIGGEPSKPAYLFANPQLVDIGRRLLVAENRQNAFARVADYIHRHDDLSRTDNLFQLANKALELTPDKGALYADYLLRAAREAAAIGAADLALRCYGYVTSQLTETDWGNRFDTCFSIYNQYLSAVAYVESEQPLFEQLARLANDRARHKEDLAVVNYTYALGLLYQQRADEAIRTALPILQQFGIHLPLEPTKLTIIGSSIRASLMLRNRTPEQVEQLPETTDPNVRLVIKMLANVSLASALTRPKMIPVIMLHQLRNSIQSGLTAESGAGFLMYAIVQSSFQGNYQTGSDMMELAIRLSRRFDAVAIELSCNLVKAIYIHHWVAPYQESLDLLLDTYRRSRENGLLTNAFNALGSACIMSIYSALPLDVVLQRSLDSLRLLSLQRQSLPEISCRIAAQLAYELQQQQPPDTFFNGPYADNKVLEPYLRKNNEFIGLINLLVTRMMWGVHLHRSQQDLSDFKEFCQQMRLLGEGMFLTPIGYFYGGLQSLQQPGPLNSEQKKIICVSIDRLKAFSNVFEGNNRSRFYLVKSQYLLRIGKTDKGLVLLDQAIEMAARYGQIVEEALAHETKARHYIALGQTHLGQRELREALDLYATRGAWAIVSRLNAEFAVARHPTTSINLAKPNERDPPTGSIDLSSFLKISTTISSNLKLGSLLTNLLNVLVENAGAQKVALLIYQNHELRVHALKETDTAVSLEVKLLNQANLPQNPIRYVSRTAKPLTLVQAYTDRVFSADPYFQQHHTLSVLVMPVIKNDELLAVIYLENNSTSGAFNSRRLEVLQLLASQIAISLENALLYDDMEERIQERTLQLRQEMDKSEVLLLNILPKLVAEELKQTGRAAARQFADVTVMFTDFVNFTRIAEQMEPDALVAELDYCFGEFDRITAEHGLEKIKTIGDAYLCTGGLPEGKPDHSVDVVRAALAIRQFIAERKAQQTAEGKPFFEVRIGVHNGPLVAGVVGTRKFAYDIWGDTVNTAARMEQSSEPGRVNVSGRTWLAVKDQFLGTFRGRVNAKNKGAIEMYFVEHLND